MNDIMFFIKSHKQQSSHFNITEYAQFSTSNTQFGASEKMFHHRCSSSIAQNFYFHHLPCLWNSLPKIDLSLSTNIIKYKLYNCSNLMTNAHTFHHLCPCCHCSTASTSPIYAVLYITTAVESLAALVRGFQYFCVYWKTIMIATLALLSVKWCHFRLHYIVGLVLWLAS